MMCCAACGITEVDEVKLKDCTAIVVLLLTACYLVKYCSVKCQKDHRPKHKRDCKKRAAELRDELLFKQPESTHLGDCPICCLPLPFDPTKSILMACCCKLICDGCDFANQMREMKEKLEKKCPFCRHPLPKSQEEFKRNLMKRVEVNDPVALHQMGLYRNQERDYENAFPHFTKAAEMGDILAHYNLAVMYREGQGVKKDKEKELHHLEQAAIGGHPYARHNLGCVELTNCRTDRAIKHWIIAANLGYEHSLVPLTDAYRKGLVSKKDLAAALRAHQAAVDATKSPKRDEAAADRLAKAARQN
eukprot:scaffold9169_cov77-Skeletonema_dohrnii-CCMP3373.AAC.2